MSNFIQKVGTCRLGTAARLAVASSTGPTATTSAFSAQCRQVRVTYASTVTNDFALFAIGEATLTIGSSSTYLPPNQPEYFTVTPGQVLSVTGSSTVSTGSLSVTECS
jgi:hypothetical protein